MSFHVRGSPSHVLRWLLLAACLLLVTLPRFNFRDPGIIQKFTATATATRYGLPLDVAGYVRLVEYYRGATPADSLIPPYCYRPLVPFAASTLPLDPLTAINVIDLVSLFLSVLVLDRILRRLGYGTRARTVGNLLFIVSFPTFYYGTIGFLDPVALLMVTIGILLTLRGSRFLLLALWVVLATLVKETNALIALLPVGWNWARGTLRPRVAVQVLVLVLLAMVTVLLVRGLSPFPERGWFWRPQLSLLWENLSRPRAHLSLVLTLGLPAALSIIAVVRGQTKRRLSRPHCRFFAFGATLVCLLYAYTLCSAYADGRVVWIIYPFLIPLALTAWWSPHDPESGLASPR